MVEFINKIIRYLISEQKSIIIVDKAQSALSNKIDNEFLLKLEKDSNTIAAKT